MILDSRFWIACASARRVEDFDQLFGFNHERFQFLFREQFGCHNQFEPEMGLVSLFQNNRDFVGKIRSGFGSKRGAVIRANRSVTATNLSRHRSALHRLGQMIDKFKYANRETHRPRLQIIGGYSSIIQPVTVRGINNQPSRIPNPHVFSRS